MLFLASDAASLSLGVLIALGGLPILLGLALIVLGRQFAAGTLGRNAVVGLRTGPMMASDAAWEAGHRAASGPVTTGGWLTVIVGIAIIAVASFTQLELALAGAVLSLLPMVPALVFLAIAVNKGNAAARQVTEQ